MHSLEQNQKKIVALSSSLGTAKQVVRLLKKKGVTINLTKVVQ